MEFIKDFNKTAIIYDDKEVSYNELIKKSLYFAKITNITQGDKALIFMENRPEFFYSFLGTWENKGVAVCVDATFSEDDLVYYIKDSESSYIFTSAKNYEVAKKAVKLSEKNIEIINVDEINYSKISEIKENSISEPNHEDVVLMLYTSGTTGNPKGVMLTFDNILINIEGLDKYKMFREDDIVLSILPLHHIFPLLGAGIIHFSFGAKIVMLKELSSDALMNAFNKYSITIIVGVPRLWEMLHKKIMAKINASKLTKNIFNFAQNIKSTKIRKMIFKKVQDNFGGHIKFLVSGGSKLDPKIAKDFYTFGFEILEGYGMTETAPMIAFTPIYQVVPGSAGKILPGIEVKLVDGEIWVRGRNVMKGYYNNPTATNNTIDKDGFLHTGDLGHMEGEYLFVTGRKKEMIVLSNGKNINPIEIEKFLARKEPLIEEVVISEIDKKLTAVIFPNFQEVVNSGVSNIQETLKWGVIDKYNSKAPKYKKILDIKIIQKEFPKTKLGKVRRFMVPDLVKVAATDDVEIIEPEFDEYIKLKEYLMQLKDGRVLPMSHLELDLGLDSLDMVELLSYLEETFGIVATEDLIVKHPTVEDLADYIKTNKGQQSMDTKNISELLKTGEPSEIPNSSKGLFIIKYLLWLPFKIYVRLKKSGIDNIDTKHAKIFVGNHQSFLDPFIFVESAPNISLTRTYSIAKIKHFKKGFMKAAANNSNVFLVDINKNLRETLKIAGKILREGNNLLIFPEGARTRDGNIQEFKKTFAILAHELNIEIQPFVINGAYKAYPTGSKLPKFSSVSIEYLEPIQTTGKTVDEIISETEKIISEKIIK